MTKARKLLEAICPPDETPINQSDINRLEKVLDIVFKKVGLDIEFTKHFVDRVNDPRNVRQITLCELKTIFREVNNEFSKEIARKKDNFQAVISGLESDINIPFVLNWNKRENIMELVNKTTLRKKNFKTRNKKFIVRA